MWFKKNFFYISICLIIILIACELLISYSSDDNGEKYVPNKMIVDYNK